MEIEAITIPLKQILAPLPRLRLGEAKKVITDTGDAKVQGVANVRATETIYNEKEAITKLIMHAASRSFPGCCCSCRLPPASKETIKDPCGTNATEYNTLRTRSMYKEQND